MEHQMIVVFRRTAQKRYAVEALRPGLPDVVMHPAPGYDRQIPHDMMHLVVEARLGISRGIFGQLAAGGNAGTFQLADKANEKPRDEKRLRKRTGARGRKLLKLGRDECIQSERATYICWREWLARSPDPERSKLGKELAQQARDTELLALNRSKLDDIFKHLDELSSHWSNLDVGQSVAVTWPDLSIVNSSR